MEQYLNFAQELRRRARKPDICMPVEENTNKKRTADRE